MLRMYAEGMEEPCPRCNYLRVDRNIITMNDGADEYAYDIIHCRCHKCGKEWVE